MRKKLLIWLLAIVMGGAAIGGAGYYYREPIKNAANHCYQQVFHRNSNAQELEPTPEPEDNAVVSKDEEYAIQLQEKQLRINALETAIADLNQTIGELNMANDAYSARLGDLTARKTELENRVAELQDTNAAITAEKQAEIDALNLSLADLQAEIEQLNADNADYIEQLAELTSRKTELENQVATLQSDIETLTAENQATIAELNATITGLNNRIQELEISNTNYADHVAELTNQKTALETQLAELQAGNTSEEQQTKIDELNASITELQTQIEQLNQSQTDSAAQITELTSQKTTLENRVTELQTANATLAEEKQTEINTLYASITELQSQIEQLNTDNADYVNQITELTSAKNTAENQVTTLQGDIETLNAEITDLNTTITNLNSRIEELENANTEYAALIANYETIKADLEAQVAELQAQVDGFSTDNKYVVNFMVDEKIYNFQVVNENENIILPNAPVKPGYKFMGWSLNGTDVVVESTITESTIYYAVYRETQLQWVEVTSSPLPRGCFPEGVWYIGDLTYCSKGYSNPYTTYCLRNGQWVDESEILTPITTCCSFSVKNFVYYKGTTYYISNGNCFKFVDGEFVKYTATSEKSSFLSTLSGNCISVIDGYLYCLDEFYGFMRSSDGIEWVFFSSSFALDGTQLRYGRYVWVFNNRMFYSIRTYKDGNYFYTHYVFSFKSKSWSEINTNGGDGIRPDSYNFVQFNGELYTYRESDKTVVVWNDDTATWEVSLNTAGNIANVDNKIVSSYYSDSDEKVHWYELVEVVI